MTIEPGVIAERTKGFNRYRSVEFGSFQDRALARATSADRLFSLLEPKVGSSTNRLARDKSPEKLAKNSDRRARFDEEIHVLGEHFRCASAFLSNFILENTIPAAKSKGEPAVRPIHRPIDRRKYQGRTSPVRYG